MYVGKAKNLRSRVSSYFRNELAIGEKTRQLIAKIHKIKIIPTASEIESLLLEANLIKKYSPFFNSRMADGKSYPLIQITVKEDVPKVLVARRKDDENSLYFGPYPNVSAMKLVLKTVRRIFPFQSVKHHPKGYCLYYHLGLCVCPPLLTNEAVKKDYKKGIKRIRTLLNGDIRGVVKELIKERDEKSKDEDFEEALALQRKIDAITLITQRVHKPFDYEVNPNLKSDIRAKELQSLLSHLQEQGVFIDKLDRIECYDISNTSGTNATGSLVVFTNGEKDTAWYRRFKIANDLPGPNDFAMMEHVIKRRIAHTEWPKPDLVIVDGGKGQVSAAKKAFANQAIPIIGLAKREEIIVTQNFEEIVLPHDTPALQLLMRIRDEAHRFAIMYHRKLRSKIIAG